MELHIETASYCNASCVFCGYRNMTREKGRMSSSLFKSIIQQVAEMKTSVFLKLAHYNEFFLDDRWFDFMKYVDDTAPKTIVHIPTNGSCLTDENLEKLITVTTFKEILFSIYSFNPRSYHELIGLPPETIGMIKNAVMTIFERRKDVRGWLGCSMELLSVEDIVCFWEAALSLMRKYPQLQPAHHVINRYGLNKEFMEGRCFYFPPERCCERPCWEPFTTMTVLYNGDVCGCCFDVNGDVHLGSLKEERLIDIWNGEKLREFREKHIRGRRGEIPLCNGCSQPCGNESAYRLFETEGVLFGKGGIPILVKQGVAASKA